MIQSINYPNIKIRIFLSIMSSILWCFFNVSILKKSYTNHKKSFSTEKNKKNNAKLSTKYWKLANKKLHPRISWSKNHTTPIQEDLVCVCTKKMEIGDDSDQILLNKRPEIISQCRHRNKYKIKTLVTNRSDRGIIS